MGRKWNNIKQGKAIKDANKSKIYAKFGREIYMAAKGMPDVEINRNLRAVVDKAKTYKVPREIIDRAINKAKSGVDENYDAVRYEGYGPNGSAVVVDALTDNVNRTVAEVRAAFNKAKGNLGVNGSVSYNFEQVCLVGIAPIDEEELLEMLLMADCDVNEVEQNEDQTLIYAPVESFQLIKDTLKDNGIDDLLVSEITMLPNETIELDEEALTRFEKLIDTLEDLDDVQNVYHNVELPEN